MRARRGFWQLVLALFVSGCGRFSVDLLPPDAVSPGPDASTGEPLPGPDGGSDGLEDAGLARVFPVDAGGSACAGESVFGVCWYLGAASATCNEECSGHGGTDARATSYVGTSGQGGSVDSCTQILAALGRPGSVTAGMRDDAAGFGCHIWPDGSRWWLQARPGFDPDSGGGGIRVACGCRR